MEAELNREENPAEPADTGMPADGQAMDLASVLDRALQLPERDWSQYSPLALAWMGDAVYELAVRTALLKQANRQADKLHRASTALVSARAQAAYAQKILPLLTEEELSFYRRGKNAKPLHKAKNAARAEYLQATGLECLLGYLYLERRYERIAELLQGLFHVK